MAMNVAKSGFSEERSEMAASQDGDNSAIFNGNVLFTPESMENVPVKPEGRIIKKAKRLTKQSPSKEDTGSSGNGLSRVPIVTAKNSRKSRTGRGRGLPKKGGAGGKGVWGKPGSELDETAECSDIHDPNYDSDTQEPYTVQRVDLALNDAELVRTVQPILQEYLEHGDCNEVIDEIQVMNFGDQRYRLPEMAMSLALDRHDPHRELTSRLISELNGAVLDQEDVERAFDELLNNIDELTLDTPDAPKVVGRFLARAVADDCVSSNYITSYKGRVDSQPLQMAMEKADLLLSINHGISRLDNVWGMGGGNRPVKSLTNRMVVLLKEYLNSGDITEATRCLKELDVPHFSHEFVYQAALIAIEDSTDRAAEVVVQLLKSLTASNVVTPDQFEKGVKRVYTDMPDICLDVPTAYFLLERLGNKLAAESLLSDNLAKEMPNRGRKRFVSEGDGGKLKESTTIQ